jgi:hypothetical protein
VEGASGTGGWGLEAEAPLVVQTVESRGGQGARVRRAPVRLVALASLGLGASPRPRAHSDESLVFGTRLPPRAVSLGVQNKHKHTRHCAGVRCTMYPRGRV